MKIIDAFTFFNELHLLELRLNILYDKVDYFILVEADKTHSNKSKPFYFEENKHNFEKFLDKIIHIKINFPKNILHTWDLENYQREQIKQGLKKISPSNNDILFISDLDEILSPQIVQNIRDENKNNFICAFKMPIFYFYLNLKFKEEAQTYYNFLYPSRGCTIAKISEYNNSLQKIRVLPPDQCTFTVENAGWHWSFLCDAQGVKEKIEAFAHQEHNNAKNTNLANIKLLMKQGKDIFGRYFDWQKCPIDNSYPDYILQHLDQYQSYIK